MNGSASVKEGKFLLRVAKTLEISLICFIEEETWILAIANALISLNGAIPVRQGFYLHVMHCAHRRGKLILWREKTKILWTKSCKQRSVPTHLAALTWFGTDWSQLRCLVCSCWEYKQDHAWLQKCFNWHPLKMEYVTTTHKPTAAFQVFKNSLLHQSTAYYEELLAKKH